MVRLYTILLIVFSVNVHAAFEQAYAPVGVGKNIIFIPIELKPDLPTQMWSSSTDGGYKLTWSKSQQATYYEIIYQYKDANGLIQSETLKVTGLFHTLHPKGNLHGAIQVRACHKYGCSAMSYMRAQTDSRLILQAVTSQQLNTTTAKISWNAIGATSITVQEKENNRVIRTTYGLSPGSGSVPVSIREGQHKLITVSALGFDGTSVSRSVNLAGQFEDISREKGTRHTQYLQPFYEKNYSIVERSVLITGNTLYFATRDFKLYRFDKQDKASYRKDPTWELKTDGLIANKPVLNNDTLYYSASYTPRLYVNGVKQTQEYSGQACAVNVASEHTPVAECNHLTTNVVASPVLVKQPERTFMNAYGLFSSAPADNVQSGLYVFGKDGQVKVLDPVDIHREIDTRTIPVEGLKHGILATPEVFLAQEESESNQFVIKSANKIQGVAVPNSNEAPSQIMQSARAFMQSLSLDTEPQPTQEKKPMSVLWEKEL